MDKKTFYAPDIDPSVLSQALYDWLKDQNYETQLLPSQTGAFTVQARKADALRTLAGMSTALTLVIASDGENLTVEMGNAKWTDKAVAGGVGVLLFAPALITAGIGVYQQSQLTSKTWRFIESYISTNSAFGSNQASPGMQYPPPLPYPQSPGISSPPSGQPARPAKAPPPLNFSNIGAAGMSPASVQVCASCKQPLRQGAKFCDNCGAPAPTSNACKSCGKALRPGARFCDNCGNPAS